jgi:aminopeptidase YwaD
MHHKLWATFNLPSMRRCLVPLLFATIPGAAMAQAPRAVPAPIHRFRELARAEYSGDSAKAIVAYMEGWGGVPGNPGYDSSIAHVESFLQRSGYVAQSRATARDRLVYRVETRPMREPAWTPVDAELTIVGQSAPLLRFATNRNMLAINSYSTPDTGVVAVVVDAGAGGRRIDSLDVAGKIVLVRGGVGRAFSDAVQKRGAIGVLAYSLPPYLKPETNVHSIQFGSVARDTARQGWGILLSHNALTRLTEAMARGPVRVRVKSRVAFDAATERTVIAEVRGSTRANERFVLSAHVQEPGANDNASGVGTLAEMARFLARQVRARAIDPKRSITMIFGNEIAQTRQYLADSARARTVRWGMSLDMTGQDVAKTGGTFLIEKMPDPSAVWTRGDEKHSEWGGEALKVSDIRPHYFNDIVLDRCLDQADGTGWIVRTNPFEGGSDHVPFLDAQKPAVLLWHFTDQFYHTDGDRLDMVSASEQKNVGICAALTALTLTTADGALVGRLAEQLRRNAIVRLDKELQLSRAALRARARVPDEQLIVRTWANYYRDAILAMRDIEVGRPSARTIARLRELSRAVERAGAERVRALGGGI